jgi:putative tricarboxylic transport membrane protein
MRRRESAAARLGRAIPYAVLLCGAAYLYVDAGQFAQVTRPGELGPDFWPRAILGLLMLVCAGAIMRGLLWASSERAKPSLRDAGGGAAAEDADDALAAAPSKPATHPYLLIAGIGLSAAYVAGLERLGFFLATALYLGLFMVFGRYRRNGVIVSTSVLGSLAFVFVFMKIVYVSLPLGVGPFHALSVAILAALGVR